MKPKLLIVDVDDTVIYWSPKYVEWLFKNNLHKIDTHEASEWFKYKTWINEFNFQSHEFYQRERIEPMCKLVESYMGKVEVLFFSACGKLAYDRQESLLQRHITYIGWKFRTVENSHEKVSEIFELSREYDIIVLDDKIETVVDLNKGGIKALSSSDTKFVKSFIDREWGYDKSK